MAVAVITGASSGMGKEFALQLAKKTGTENLKIDEFWLLGRSEERLIETKKKIMSIYSIRKVKPVCKCISLNFESEDWKDDLNEILKNHHPDISFLVHAAGYGIIGEFSDSTSTDQTNMVRVNCEALTFLCHACIPHMKRGSHIVLFASSAAFLPQPGFAVYAATKSYVLSFGRALRGELKKKEISVTSVCPGPVDTPFFERAEAGAGKKKAWYKNLVMANARGVSAQALQDAMKNNSVSVYGIPMKVFRVLAKVVPHELILGLLK